MRNHLTPLQLKLIMEMETGKHGLQPIISARGDARGCTQFDESEESGRTNKIKNIA